MILYKLAALVGVDGWRQIKFLGSPEYQIYTVRFGVVNIHLKLPGSRLQICTTVTTRLLSSNITGECGAVSNRHKLSVSHKIFTQLSFS